MQGTPDKKRGTSDKSAPYSMSNEKESFNSIFTRSYTDLEIEPPTISLRANSVGLVVNGFNKNSSSVLIYIK
jgi:hypothetical protein